ncbi:MAG: hypothetical protein ACLFTA_01070 [Candidatus Nanohaloarchaea archaeon]
MSFIADSIEFMSQTDVIHLFFPWLLVLAFTFGVLEKYEFFEDETINAAISISFAFLSIGGIYFFAPANIFVNFGAVLAFAAFVALGFLIVMAVAGIDIDDMTDEEQNIPLYAGLGILGLGLVAVIGFALGVPEMLSGINISPEIELVQDVFMPVLLLGFILGVIYLTSR